MAEITSLIPMEQSGLASSADVNYNFEALRVGHNTNNESIEVINTNITGINNTLEQKANRDLSNLTEEGKSSLMNSTIYAINKGKVDDSGYPDILNAPGSGTVIQIEDRQIIPSNAPAPFYAGEVIWYTTANYSYTFAEPFQTAEGTGTITFTATTRGNKQPIIRVTIYFSDGTSITPFAQQCWAGTTYSPTFETGGKIITGIGLNNSYWYYGEEGTYAGMANLKLTVPYENVIHVSTADTLYFNATYENPIFARNVVGDSIKKTNLYPISIVGMLDGTYNVYIPKENKITYLLKNNVTISKKLPEEPSLNDICVLDYEPMEVKIYKAITTESTADLSSDNIELELDINIETFETQINTSGIYNFIYNGSTWSLNGDIVNLASYGITVSGTPEATNVIEVEYTKGTTTNQWVDFEDIPCGSITILNSYIDKVVQPIFNANYAGKNIVEVYTSEKSGYFICGNGYCEQWGHGNGAITLLKEYKDTNYNVLPNPVSKTVTGFSLSSESDWQAKGYLY